MPLAITPNVKVVGVSLKAIQQPTGIKICRMEKTCMGKVAVSLN